MYQLNRIAGTRIIATPSALDNLKTSASALVLRLAPDELFVDQIIAAEQVEDLHAIVVPDAGLAGMWMPADEALDFLERSCEWELPSQRPAFAQGMVAGIATKLWFEADRVLFVVPAPFIEEFAERLQ